MGISGDFKRLLRKRFPNKVFHQELDFKNEKTAPNIYVVDMCILIFGKPKYIKTGRELIDEYIMKEIDWFLKTKHGETVVLAWDTSKYVPASKYPTQKKRDDSKKDYIPDNKVFAEITVIADGLLETNWQGYLGDRERRATIYNWIRRELDKILPNEIAYGKKVILCYDGKAFGYCHKEYAKNELGKNQTCYELKDLENKIGEADFIPTYIEQQMNIKPPHNKNILIYSTDQDNIVITLLLIATRFNSARMLRNNIYVNLSNRWVKEEKEREEIIEQRRRKKLGAMPPLSTQEKKDDRRIYVKEYFYVNECWRQLMTHYRAESRYESLSNPIENLCFIMLLSRCDYCVGITGRSGTVLWETFEEHYETIGGPLIISDQNQYYSDEFKNYWYADADDEKGESPQCKMFFKYQLNYRSLWRFIRIIEQDKIKTKIANEQKNLILPYDTLYTIAKKHYSEKTPTGRNSVKLIETKEEMNAKFRNALYGVHYMANGFLGKDSIPDCLEIIINQKNGERKSKWGFEKIDKSKDYARKNVQYAKDAYGNFDEANKTIYFVL